MTTITKKQATALWREVRPEDKNAVRLLFRIGEAKVREAMTEEKGTDGASAMTRADLKDTMKAYVLAQIILGVFDDAEKQ